MKRVALFAMVALLAGCAQPSPTPPPPAPTAPPLPSAASATPAARLTVSGTIRESCGSIGGCAYFVELSGRNVEAAAELTPMSRQGLVLMSGLLPEALAAGDYTLTLSSRFVSDEIDNGRRKIGPFDAECSAAFAVDDRQKLVEALVLFDKGSCSLHVAA